MPVDDFEKKPRASGLIGLETRRARGRRKCGKLEIVMILNGVLVGMEIRWKYFELRLNF